MDVKINGATQTPGENEKFCYLHNEAFRGGAGKVQKWIEIARKENWLGVLWWFEDGSRMNVFTHGLNLSLVPKIRAPGHFIKMGEKRDTEL